MLVVKNFNTNFLPEKKSFYKNKYSKSLRKNTVGLHNWVMSTLKSFVPDLLPGYKYNATSLYLNDNNLEEIRKHVDPFTFLNIGPTTDDSLADDELGVDISNIMRKDNYNS